MIDDNYDFVLNDFKNILDYDIRQQLSANWLFLNILFDSTQEFCIIWFAEDSTTYFVLVSFCLMMRIDQPVLTWKLLSIEG